MKLLSLLLGILWYTNGCLADSLVVRIQPMWLGAPWQWGDKVTFDQGELTIQSLWLYWGHEYAPDSTTYYLFGQDDDRLRWQADLTNAVKDPANIKCAWGVDSLTQVVGILRGDLDPKWGMYWTWQSGYICAKVEAVIRWNNQTETDVVLHLGGYRSPTCFKPNEYSVGEGGLLVIPWQLDRFFLSHDWHSMSKCMTPGAEATSIFHTLIPE